jgi:hypothetical protein
MGGGGEEEKWINSRVMHLDSTTHIVIVLSMINAVM